VHSALAQVLVLAQLLYLVELSNQIRIHNDVSIPILSEQEGGVQSKGRGFVLESVT
jgi:hypothetical protein